MNLENIEAGRTGAIASNSSLNGREFIFSARDIAPIMRANLAFIGAVIAFFVLIALFWMKVSGPSYISRMAVGDAEGLPQMTSNVSLLSGMGGGGLGSLLGASNRSPLYHRFEELLTSQRVAGLLERKHHVMRHIFRKQWDASNNRWGQPSGILAEISAAVHAFFGMPAWAPPGNAELSAQLQKSLTISDTKDTNLRQIEYQDSDREFALNILRWLYEEADNSIRLDDIALTRGEITYLRRELENVTGVEHRTAITNLLEVEERRQMLLLSNAPYGAAVIVPPEAPTRPNSPKISFTLALAIIVGFLASSLYLLWKAASLRQRLVISGTPMAEAIALTRGKIVDVSPGRTLRAMAAHFTR